MMGIIADRDIGAQETCHMLQKLPRNFYSIIHFTNHQQEGPT